MVAEEGSVTDPRVRFQKSNGAPDVSVSTNLGFWRGRRDEPAPIRVGAGLMRRHQRRESEEHTEKRISFLAPYQLTMTVPAMSSWSWTAQM